MPSVKHDPTYDPGMTSNTPSPTHIDVGHALITMIEPTTDPDRLVEYNRWYDHDHAYAGVMAGPGAFAYRRFVATRDLKPRRRSGPSPLIDPITSGSFIGLYWLQAGSAEEHYTWSFPNTAGLGQVGRMNPDREHISTSLYDLVHVVDRPGWTVPVEIALDYPAAGVLVIWVDRRPEATLDAVSDWLRDTLFPGVLPGTAGAQAATWRPRDFPGLDGTGSAVGERLCATVLLTEDPRTSDTSLIDAIASALDSCPVATLALAAEFIPVVPGTTTYLDQLW